MLRGQLPTRGEAWPLQAIGIEAENDVMRAARCDRLQVRRLWTVVLILVVPVVLASCGMGGFFAQGEDVDVLERRLDSITDDDSTLRTPAPGAELHSVDSRLCRDSGPPAVEFRYLYPGTFDDALAFYKVLLEKAGWRQTAPVAFQHPKRRWEVTAVMSNYTYPRDELAGTRGYSLYVRIGDGYESGCESRFAN